MLDLVLLESSSSLLVAWRGRHLRYATLDHSWIPASLRAPFSCVDFEHDASAWWLLWLLWWWFEWLGCAEKGGREEGRIHTSPSDGRTNCVSFSASLLSVASHHDDNTTTTTESRPVFVSIWRANSAFCELLKTCTSYFGVYRFCAIFDPHAFIACCRLVIVQHGETTQHVHNTFFVVFLAHHHHHNNKNDFILITNKHKTVLSRCVGQMHDPCSATDKTKN